MLDDIVKTNYIGMRIGRFTVIESKIDHDTESIELTMKCGNCGTVRHNSLVYKERCNIRCRQCGRYDILIPISYYKGTNMVKDTIHIGEYQYRKLRKTYNIEKDDWDYEVDFILSNILDKYNVSI